MAGIRVVDLTSVVFGPYATQIMADMGADVIKIEPPAGDNTRHITVGPEAGMGGIYVNVNRGKRSLMLDLRQEADKAVLRKLIATADVFIHSMRGSAIAKLGFSYEAVSAIRPDIVYTNCYGYSRRGPEADQPAYDDTIQAECGITHVQGLMNGEPGFVATIMADKVAGAALVYNDKHWNAFMAAVKPAWETDEFSTLEKRAKQIGRVYGLLGETFLTRTTQEWLDLLRELHIPCAILRTTDELFDNEHLNAIGFFETIDTPQGPTRFPGVPTWFSATPGQVQGPAPRLGEHNAALLTELGLDTESQ
ncbi:MAG: CoA transferase [Novosphingobium sp.]|nr:MAG: CoA transferase [Novosphingobium sp.]